MNNIEAFKNELRNYRYYQNYIEELKTTSLKLLKIDDCNEKFELLKTYSKELVECEQELDATYTQLTGFHAIRYDKEPSAPNEHLSEMIKLDLIDKYNVLLKQFEKLIDEAETKLYKEMERTQANINRIESILIRLPNNYEKTLISIYCDGSSYEKQKRKANYSKSGLYQAIEKELLKILKK